MDWKCGPALAAVALCLAASEAAADGVYKIYDYREDVIGELVLEGDVHLGSAGKVAMLTLASQNMVIYVPTEAIYLTLEESNPIIRQRQVFEGGWISTDPNAERIWGACGGPAAVDHWGRERTVWGDIEWITTDLVNGFPEVVVRLGQCGNGVNDWGWTNVALDFPPVRIAPPIEPPVEAQAMETCGNNPDIKERALGCSDVIANPFSDPSNVSWAHWSRAYVRCGTAPARDIIADLVEAARTDTAQWQEYYARASDYQGPEDGVFSTELYGAIVKFAEAGCR